MVCFLTDPRPRGREAAAAGTTRRGRRNSPGSSASSVWEIHPTVPASSAPIRVQVPAIPSTADLIRSIWPAEDRPVELQQDAIINSMSMDTVLALKRCWDEKKKKEEKSDDTFRKDADIPTKRYEAGPDNCNDLLHPARWERDPICEPKAFWYRVPTKRSHCYRRLALDHLGAANMISEHSIIRAHDRTAALEIKMFYSGNYTKKSFLATENKVARILFCLFTRYRFVPSTHEAQLKG